MSLHGITVSNNDFISNLFGSWVVVILFTPMASCVARNARPLFARPRKPLLLKRVDCNVQELCPPSTQDFVKTIEEDVKVIRAYKEDEVID
jgi:hypothetical protein